MKPRKGDLFKRKKSYRYEQNEIMVVLKITDLNAHFLYRIDYFSTFYNTFCGTVYFSYDEIELL